MEKEKKQKKQKKIKIKDIISNIVIWGVLLIVAIQLVNKFTGHTPYFFGYRHDVVLTDSMSEVNNHHVDFLKGHDDQLQPFDYIISKKINDKTELNVYDIVVFNHPLFGETVHRIVDIKEINGVIKYATRGDKVDTIDGYFDRAAIIAKVDRSIPKLGKIVVFMQSFYGHVMIIGLVVIYATYSYLSDKGEEDDDEKEEQETNALPNNDEHEETIDNAEVAGDNPNSNQEQVDSNQGDTNNEQND